MWRALLAARHRGWNSPFWCSSGPQGSVAMVVGLDLWYSLGDLLLFSSWGIYIKVSVDEVSCFFFQYFFSPSSAIFHSPKVAIAGLGPLLNRCTVILILMIRLDGLSLNQRNGRKFWCFGSTWNKLNIWSMSHIIAILSWQKRINTPTRLFITSGPGRSSLLSETPWNSADKLNTTCIWSGFLGWYTPKWGKYHTHPLLPTPAACSQSNSEHFNGSSFWGVRC